MALVVFPTGVNVGGHKVFRPAALAGDLAHLGAEDGPHRRVVLAAGQTGRIRGPDARVNGR